MTIRRAKPPLDESKVFDEADMLIIVGRALGMSYEATGDYVCTPTFPTGVAERTVRNRIAANRDAYDRLITRISLSLRKKQEEIEELSEQAHREALARLSGKAVRVRELTLDHAISSPNDSDALAIGNKAAEAVEDRRLGKAAQVHKVGGAIAHLHAWNPQPIRKLAAQELDMLDSRKLLEAIPDDVIEGAVIE